MKVTRRTYPQPDLGRLTPRLRALNLMKYLMGLEPEEAIVHPAFALVEASYASAEERGAVDFFHRFDRTGRPDEDTFNNMVEALPRLRTDEDSLADLLVTGATIKLRQPR